MSRGRDVDPDAWYDRRMDTIIEAQRTCPYYQQLEHVEGLQDDRLCLYDHAPCEQRRHCPCGKW